MKREIYIKEIIEELGILRYKIELLSAANLQDSNIVAEYHIQEILNALFDYNLKSSNYENHNSAAIDLYDKENSVAVQVTSTNRKTKVQETLTKFFENNLDADYSILMIIVLGKKLNSYSNLKLPDNFNFNYKEHIVDFSEIISKVMILPMVKIEKIRSILKSDKLIGNKKISAKTVFKRNQTIQKKLTKNLPMKNLTIEDFEHRYYMPYRFFIYDSLVIRSIEDKAYPDNDEDETTPFPSWYKAQIHDFYEYGLEIFSNYNEDIVTGKDGKWNYLQGRKESEIAKPFKVLRTHVLHRIPYENIVDIDMNPEYIYGYPTLSVEYNNERKPYIEEIPFLIGYYKDEKDFRKGQYFELKKRDCNL